MFGSNKLKPTVWNDKHASSELREGQALSVHSIWATIQGEGPLAGCPAVFIRLEGCNLRCWFCDTDFENGDVLRCDEIITRIAAYSSIKLVVITGGEPLRQPITLLCARLLFVGYQVQIETAGIVCPPDFDALQTDRFTIVCSPKTSIVHKTIRKYCRHYKYIVNNGDFDEVTGLPTRSTQTQGKIGKLFFPSPRDSNTTIWVQPCDVYNSKGERADSTYALNVAACVRIAMKHGYRISLQQHKILKVD